MQLVQIYIEFQIKIQLQYYRYQFHSIFPLFFIFSLLDPDFRRENECVSMQIRIQSPELVKYRT